MTDTPKQRFLNALYRTTGQCPQESTTGALACCPAHDDKTPSLSVGAGDDGRVLVKCFAGCSAEAICQAVGLKLADLMPPRESTRSGKKRTQNPQKSTGPSGNCEDSEDRSRIVETYDYRDERGQLLYQVCRLEPKGFRQRKPHPSKKNAWDWSVKGVRQVPYRLPELLADSLKRVLIVEGEKDADRLARLGFLATCNSGGAGKWKPEFSEFFRGRSVAILPDNDEAGRKHADEVARSLQGAAAAISIISLPELPEKGDASDWVDAGGTAEQLRVLVEAASPWEPKSQLGEWSEIEPLDAVALPKFPVVVLPKPLRQWVEEESHATQTPPDLAGLLALAVISATIAKRVEVEARPGWREPVNLFVAVLLEPGNRKSAVFTDAIKPLREIETELIEAARGGIAILQSQRRQKERQLKRLEEQAAKGGSDSAQAAHESIQLAEELAREDEPILPRRIADDATAEKLGIILAQQGGRIASLSPEGGVFDLMAGQYSKSGIPQFNVYLMGHSGDDILTDRVSRQSVSVKRPALTCGYAIQPAVIEGIAKNAAFRGRGLLARFLYAAPRSWIGHRQIAPKPMALATGNAYRDIVRTLSTLEGETVLSLTVDAEMRLETWEEEIERTLADGGDMEMIRDWGSKLAGATLRLAAALHCVKNRGTIGQIDDETLISAIRIASFLIPHAEHVLTLMDLAKESADGDAHYVFKWIKENQLREFTKRDAHQHGRRRFRKADDIDPALALLADRGYIRLKPVDPEALNKPGRPPSPRYEVNPVVFENQNSKDRTQNPHKSNAAPPYNLSEDSEDRFFKAENQNRERFTI